MLVVGQAPGTKVHATGIPFNDPSGVRLRDWMGIDRERFYDERSIALLPMGFCYPGRGASGDLPPPPRCAELWRARLLAELPDIALTLVVGQYAIRWHLPNEAGSLTDVVRRWRNFAPGLIPAPHPSPRNNLWLRRNPWFDAEVVPAMREAVAAALLRS
ncbi:MAG: uracil-DNA glycosylase family protein [Pseudomonadota bacterium]